LTEVRFYHLTRTSLDAALPTMLERTLARDQRALVMAGSEERVEALNARLWTYQERSFLPHGSARDGYPGDQPVWLTTEAENPNRAQVLFLTDGAEREGIDGFQLCAILFDGQDEVALQAARAQWRRLESQGHALTYWKQDERGAWSQQEL